MNAKQMGYVLNAVNLLLLIMMRYIVHSAIYSFITQQEDTMQTTKNIIEKEIKKPKQKEGKTTSAYNAEGKKPQTVKKELDALIVDWNNFIIEGDTPTFRR